MGTFEKRLNEYIKELQLDSQVSEALSNSIVAASPTSMMNTGTNINSAEGNIDNEIDNDEGVVKAKADALVKYQKRLDTQRAAAQAKLAAHRAQLSSFATGGRTAPILQY
jgi:hypothetical protein